MHQWIESPPLTGNEVLLDPLETTVINEIAMIVAGTE
jgi:hypothetical protein